MEQDGDRVSRGQLLSLMLNLGLMGPSADERSVESGSLQSPGLSGHTALGSLCLFSDYKNEEQNTHLQGYCK